MSDDYNFEQIEEKWQGIWKKDMSFEVEEDPGKRKYYCLEMYPYPSGRIHMGHVRNYSIGDVISRFKFMRGYNVLHPIGWDALGMPAENAAIQHGIHPQEWTLDNIAHMKKQLQKMGISYDWSREVNTCLPEYYRWNQWIFLKMLERGLAYRRKSRVNWCPSCQTVLANEQAAGGICWRCDAQVEQKEMVQWFLKITDYAEELLSGHDLLEKWPEHVLMMQKNWIGKSTGAHISFPVPSISKEIEVFTTRIDTIYGATFVVLSPEHPICAELLARSSRKRELQQWISRTISESQLKRGTGEEAKEGIATGEQAINPFNGQPVPIWVANYVLMEYGTGAIMAVPAHDQRDFDFAQKYSLPVKTVIVPEDKSSLTEPATRAFEGYGLLQDSGPFSGLLSAEAIERMSDFAQKEGFGRKKTIYRLRDWGISRQRYWGTPIPVIYCPKCGIVGVPYKDLPVEIPYEVELTGKEGSPLEKVMSFVETTCPKCRGKARRETDTMDTFFDSSWYFFRYASPEEKEFPLNPQAAAYWLPVDLYIGGVEHAILHLIYARFFTKVLRDLGLTSISEPFPHYLAQGMVTKDGAAMSKSRGNIVDPDEIIKKYGADALRVFILFASPPEKEFAWLEEGIEGCNKFLGRIWTFFHENKALFRQSVPGRSDADLPETQESYQRVLRKMHQAVKKVTEDVEKRFHLNTAISAIMEFYNQLKRERESLLNNAEGRALMEEALEKLILLLSLFAPHICEELWERAGHKTILARTPWPDYDPDLAREDMVTIVVQVNGKVRERFEAPADLAEADMEKEALELSRIRDILSGKKVIRVICVKNKLVNIVVEMER